MLLYHISTKSIRLISHRDFSFSGSRGNAIQPPKKAFTYEMKLSLYKKSLQNTISFSRPSSFSRTPGQSWRLTWSPGELISGTPCLLPVLYLSFHFFPCFSSVSRGCATSVFRFVVPLYKTQSYYSPGTSQGSVCPPKYMGISGILPQAGCFENLKWSKVASFCGSECFFCRVLFFYRFSLYNLYFSLVGHLVQSSGLTALTSSS